MKKLFYTTCIFLCANISIKASDLLTTPDSLFQKGNYAEAILEYERAIFLTESDSIQNIARLKKTKCLRSIGNYADAYLETTKLDLSKQNSFYEENIYESAICAYLFEHYNEALIWIEQLKTIPNFTKQKEILLIETLSNSQLKQWENAHNAANTYINIAYLNEQRTNKINEINNIFTHKLPRLKNEKVLEYLMIVPGLGQAYTGYPFEGLLNAGMNLSFLAFGAYQFYYGFYITGYFTGALGINKVYFGGQSRSHFLLEKHNYEELKKFDANLKNTLLN